MNVFARYLFGLTMLLCCFMARGQAQESGDCDLRNETPVGPDWILRTIDNSSEGADGVKLADFNNDGKLDIVTGWEEGGRIRIYLHPGVKDVTKPWPRIDVGEGSDAEDAVFADLDGDGDLDVVSCCEGTTQAVYFYYNETPKVTEAEPAPKPVFRKVAVPALEKQSRWMFAWPRDMDGKNGMDLVVGSKDPEGVVCWLESPDNPADVNSWKRHWLTSATWIMSIWFADMDNDGDEDIVFTDRMGKTSGVRWLERPDSDPAGQWQLHRIWTNRHDILSMTPTDLDGDGLDDFVVAVKDHRVIWLRRTRKDKPVFDVHTIHLPITTGNTRAVTPGDLDGDGDLDLAVTTWNAKDIHGVVWLENDGTPLDGGWILNTLSGTMKGIKYDRIELLDVDEDGDLDLLTCEEHELNGGLGVIWYENPHTSAASDPTNE